MPDEFWRVTLLDPARRCCWCAEYAYREGKPQTHHASHRMQILPSGTPQDWQVTGEVRGDAVAVGTTLRLVDECYRTFYDCGGSGLFDWLLEAIDGPDPGAIFYVQTSAWNDEMDRHLQLSRVEQGVRRHPLWPTGIEPIRGSDTDRV